ncbi:hypothetical protein EMCRGX_G018781 [Ephydatia muelleri]
METYLLTILASPLLIVVLAYFLWPGYRPINLRMFPRKYNDEKGKKRPYYDVLCVGAGPSGSCLGYYLAKQGWKIALLEKKQFPRDKICGDAVCKTGIEILMEMGLYDTLVKEKKAHVSDAGGLVSPGGLSYIGQSHKVLGKVPGALACKRIVLDETLVRAAQKSGAELIENTPVKDAHFDKTTGLWTVTIEDSDVTYQGRVLICADGSTSKLATQLGLVSGPPQATCSRSYIGAGTHSFKADGVMFYPKGILPGYGVLFRHANDELGYCCYLVPGNPKVTNDTLTYWHEHLLKDDPVISRAIGKSKNIERMKAGSLRVGGEKNSYDDHLLVIGDAAGMIDPMTGEGIHHAMESGKIAAEFLNEAFEVGNFDKEVMKEYQNRWMYKFGSDYKWSMFFVQMTYRYPILLDAATAAMQRKGNEYLARWADIMTGRIPKFNLLRPEFAIVMGYEVVKLTIQSLLGMDPRKKATPPIKLAQD